MELTEALLELPELELEPVEVDPEELDPCDDDVDAEEEVLENPPLGWELVLEVLLVEEFPNWRAIKIVSTWHNQRSESSYASQSDDEQDFWPSSTAPYPAWKPQVHRELHWQRPATRRWRRGKARCTLQRTSS